MHTPVLLLLTLKYIPRALTAAGCLLYGRLQVGIDLTTFIDWLTTYILILTSLLHQYTNTPLYWCHYIVILMDYTVMLMSLHMLYWWTLPLYWCHYTATTDGLHRYTDGSHSYTDVTTPLSWSATPLYWWTTWPNTHATLILIHYIYFMRARVIILTDYTRVLMSIHSYTDPIHRHTDLTTFFDWYTMFLYW